MYTRLSNHLITFRKMMIKHFLRVTWVAASLMNYFLIFFVHINTRFQADEQNALRDLLRPSLHNFPNETINFCSHARNSHEINFSCTLGQWMALIDRHPAQLTRLQRVCYQNSWWVHEVINKLRVEKHDTRDLISEIAKRATRTYYEIKARQSLYINRFRHQYSLRPFCLPIRGRNAKDDENKSTR